MSRRLQGKVTLITGASRGIGKATAELFAREGASVVVNYRKSADEARQVIDEIRKAGGRGVAIQADVANRDAVRVMVERVIAEFERIDILINNAGVLHRGSTLTMTEENLDEMIAVNVKGIIHCAQAVAPGMIERRYGKIVNISSLAGLGTAVADTTPYAVTKAAVIALTKRMALELGPHGINVNAICPGFIRTEMLGLATARKESQEKLDALARKAILGRVGEPEDVAHTALFLAGDESSFMTAQVLTVDGGRTDFLSYSA